MKQNLLAEKVYLYSLCEYWGKDEIEYDDKLRSEHLHFHLLPRYRRMRHKQLAAEKIFDIPAKKELSKSLMKTLKDEILGDWQAKLKNSLSKFHAHIFMEMPP